MGCGLVTSKIGDRVGKSEENLQCAASVKQLTSASAETVWN